MRVEEKYKNHPAMQLLCRSVQREVRLQIIFAFFFSGVSAILLYSSFMRNTLLTIVALSCLIFSLRFLFRSFGQYSLEKNRLLLLLNGNQEAIVWIFGVKTQRLPFGLRFLDSGVLYFKLADGDEISISVPSKKLKLVSHFLNRILPNTVFGYTPERAEKYEQSPSSLRFSD